MIARKHFAQVRADGNDGLVHVCRCELFQFKSQKLRIEPLSPFLDCTVDKILKIHTGHLLL